MLLNILQCPGQPPPLQKRIIRPQMSIMLRLRTIDLEVVWEALPGPQSGTDLRGTAKHPPQGLSLVHSGLTPSLSYGNKMQSLVILNFGTDR